MTSSPFATLAHAVIHFGHTVWLEGPTSRGPGVWGFLLYAANTSLDDWNGHDECHGWTSVLESRDPQTLFFYVDDWEAFARSLSDPLVALGHLG